MSQHVNIEESQMAMAQIFAPNQYFAGAEQILHDVNSNMDFNVEVADLVNKFTQGTNMQ